MSAQTAARSVMAATIGAALSLISQPDLFGDDTFATDLREAVIASITAPEDPAPTAKRRAPAAEPALATAAAMLSSKLTAGGHKQERTAPGDPGAGQGAHGRDRPLRGATVETRTSPHGMSTRPDIEGKWRNGHGQETRGRRPAPAPGPQLRSAPCAPTSSPAGPSPTTS
jgi:hypothetical protein